MKYIIALFFTFTFFTVTGQTKQLDQPQKIDVSTYIWKVYDSLKEKGATNLISVQRRFFGMHILDSLGGPDMYFDIFWQINDITSFQEIKYYGDRVIRNPVKVISNSGIFSFLKDYYDSIKTEEILPFVLKSERNGIESYNPVMPIHKSYYDLLIFSEKDDMIQISFEASYLQENLGLGKDYANLNYRYNNSTKLMLLWNKLWGVINN